MKILSSFALIALAFCVASCQTPAVQPSDASEAVYEAPDRIDNQRNVQQMHDDILQQRF